MNIFLILWIFASSMSCSDSELGKGSELKGNNKQSEKSESADAELIEADEPKAVAGSYLTCEAIENPNLDSAGFGVGCAVMAENSKVLLPQAGIQVAISVRDMSRSYTVSEYSKTSQSSPWHWRFQVPNRYRLGGLVRINFSSAMTHPTNMLYETQIPLLSPYPVADLKSSPDGLLGGHIDIDTAREFYPFGAGITDAHVHEYDKKYQTNGVDFLNLKDANLISLNNIAAYKGSFKISILNSKLSPDAGLILNGQKLSVDTFNKLSQKFLFRVGEPSSPSEISLSELKLTFSENSILDRRIVKTEPKCVASNIQGPNGEYRNGALTIQFVSPNSMFDSISGAAQEGLIWEASVYWHNDVCS